MSGTASKVALVTGAGSGIGAAVSRGLAAAGFAVVLAGRRAEPLAALAADIIRADGKAWPMTADVADENSVCALFARIEAQCARLDVLFNNAGASHRAAPLEELSRAEWQTVLDVNLTGAFLCTQQAFSMMQRQAPRGGRIINNGSVSAQTPRPHSVAYAASKHGLTGLTRATALEGRPYDIACGQIDIGNVATAIGAELVTGTLQADGSIAPEPTMDVSDVARAVVYMASLPLTANVLSMTVMATQMPLVGRG
jgi:NAD(P)-dependent dehydrogenase (short-subunit alcohol dehydrogenase family)